MWVPADDPDGWDGHPEGEVLEVVDDNNILIRVAMGPVFSRETGRLTPEIRERWVGRRELRSCQTEEERFKDILEQRLSAERDEAAAKQSAAGI